MLWRERELELRGVPVRDIAAFCLDQGGTHSEPGLFEGENWIIKINELGSLTLGVMRINRVAVTIRAAEDRWEELWARFQLRFLRPGG